MNALFSKALAGTGPMDCSKFSDTEYLKSVMEGPGRYTGVAFEKWGDEIYCFPSIYQEPETAMDFFKIVDEMLRSYPEELHVPHMVIIDIFIYIGVFIIIGLILWGLLYFLRGALREFCKAYLQVDQYFLDKKAEKNNNK